MKPAPPRLLTPLPALPPSFPAWSVLGLLFASLAALMLAPLLMPDSYAWVRHTTSASAAQGLDGAWLARLGFLLFGFAVLRLALAYRARWGRGTLILHVLFGVCMIAAAAFSEHPWETGPLFDEIEDALHSVTATGMGFAFALGVLMRLFERTLHDERGRLFDSFAILAAAALPLGMLAWPGVEGLLQRLMFLTAYAWYGREALHLLRPYKHATPPVAASLVFLGGLILLFSGRGVV